MAPANSIPNVIELDDEDEIPSNAKGTPVNGKGRKLKSKVWEHMIREVLSDETVKATCNYCSTTFSGNQNSGTSHLKRHIGSCSKRVNHDIRNYCISGIGASTMSLKYPSVNLEEVRRAICIYVVAGAHPFATCKEPGFKYMVSTMCPQFKLISGKTLKRDAMKYFNDERCVILELLQNACGRISFTTDNWRSEHTDDEYMCITAHWIDNNWELQKRIIKFAALTPPFDGRSLADEIALCLGQ